jgi:hypothetical protein
LAEASGEAVRNIAINISICYMNRIKVGLPPQIFCSKKVKMPFAVGYTESKLALPQWPTG